MARAAAADGAALSIALVGNAAEIEPAWAAAGERFDVVTDQTSAHDALAGYVPAEISLDDAAELRRAQPDVYEARSKRSMADHVRAILAFQAAGAVAFDYGNNLRAQAQEAGVANAFDYPGFVPAFIRPQFCEGRGPFRWAALSGDPEDILRTDRAVLELFPEDAGLRRWIEMAEARVPFQGLPARICWLGYGERAKAGLEFNRLVAAGEVRAPIVIGRDHLDAGSVASPNRETEAMADGSDAIADWPLLNALVNTAAGATWVSIHHGGGVGIGYSQHAGMVVRRRWHRARGAQARAGAHDRPRHGRRPPRGRGLRARDRRRPRARRPHPDARGLIGLRRLPVGRRRRPPRRVVVDRLGHRHDLADATTGRPGRNAQQAADRAHPDRRVEADQVAEHAADDRAQGDRAPHDEPHRRVHPALHPGRRDRLAQRDLVDVPGDPEEAAHEPEQRERGEQVVRRGDRHRQAGQAEPDRRQHEHPAHAHTRGDPAGDQCGDEDADRADREREPDALGGEAASRLTYRIRIAPITLPKKFDVPVVAAIERSQRCPVT